MDPFLVSSGVLDNILLDLVNEIGGTFKNCMTWEGMLSKVDLVSTVLLVILSILAFHLASLECMLSITN